MCVCVGGGDDVQERREKSTMELKSVSCISKHLYTKSLQKLFLDKHFTKAKEGIEKMKNYLGGRVQKGMWTCSREE